MRQLIIGMLLIILIFSITIVFLRPAPKQNFIPDTTSHASKLIQQKQEINEEEDVSTTQIKETTNNEPDKEMFNNLNTRLKTDTNSKDIEISLDKAENNENLNKIKQELSQKYDNNPNAEISEDDLIIFLQKAAKVNN